MTRKENEFRTKQWKQGKGIEKLVLNNENKKKNEIARIKQWQQGKRIKKLELNNKVKVWNINGLRHELQRYRY